MPFLAVHKESHLLIFTIQGRFDFLAGSSKPLELVFVVDASSQVSDQMLHRIRDFITLQGRIYNISSQTRFKIISYADSVDTILTLQDGVSVRALREGLEQLKRTGGDRHTEKALQNVQDMIVNKRDGIRENAGKVVVVVMNGANSRQSASGLLKSQARALRQTGVEVVVVAIGSAINDNEVNEIAGSPGNVVKVRSADDVNVATATISVSSTRALSRPLPLDLGFVLGIEGLSDTTDFNLARDVIEAILTKLEIGENATRVGLISARSTIPLSDLADRARMLALLRNLQVPGAFPLSEAIDSTASFFFADNSGARSGVPKTAVIFVNNELDAASQLAAKKLIANGANIVTIAVGQNADTIRGLDSGTRKGPVKVRDKDDVASAAESALKASLPGD